jgi:hypothetical protein
MAMKTGGGNLFKRKTGGSLRILVICKQVVQESFRGYTKGKQQQKYSRRKTSYGV